MTPERINALKEALPNMSSAEKMRVLDLLEEWEKREEARKARDSLLTFVKRINPVYKIGPHHKIIAERLQLAARGELDRLATALAPRFGKSLLLSLYFPAWFMGNFPDQKLIISSHTADLAIDFGKKVRNLIDSGEYKEIFPEVALAPDSKAAGSWSTNKGGSFFAVGVGGAVAGRGADLCLAGNTTVIVDDEPRFLRDVIPGQTIQTHFGRQKIIAKSLTIHKQVVKINNTVLASLQHPFLTTEGWVHAEKLKKGGRICTTTVWMRLWNRVGFLRKSQPANRGKA